MTKSLFSRCRQARLALNLQRDPGVPRWTKFTLPLAVLVYVLSPIDLIPDYLFGIGQIDDFTVALVAAAYRWSLLRHFAPAYVVNDYT